MRWVNDTRKRGEEHGVEKHCSQRYGNFIFEPEKSAQLANDIIERIKQEKLPVGLARLFLKDLIDELDEIVIVK